MYDLNKHDIEVHIQRVVSLGQIISTLNNDHVVRDCLITTIAGESKKLPNLHNDLLSNMCNGFWSEFLMVAAPNETPIAEALHGKSEYFVQNFKATLGEKWPLLGLEDGSELYVVAIDYLSNRESYSVYRLDEHGYKITAVSGITSLKRAIEASHNTNCTQLKATV